MSTLTYIIIFSFIGSVGSLIGGIILLYKEKFAYKISHLLAAFAAGALLGTAFFDLLPEATEEAASRDVFIWVLIGILTFFLLERLLHWFHHHHREHPDDEAKPTIPLIMAGDSLHNFIDGVTIAATFMVSVPLGIVTSLAVAAHEIPQEIGDFGMMLHKGMPRKKIILFNLASAGVAMIGALLMYFIGGMVEGYLPYLLALVAGFFIYIAASDIIPEIHHKNRKGLAAFESFMLILGVVVVWISVSLLEGFHGH